MDVFVCSTELETTETATLLSCTIYEYTNNEDFTRVFMVVAKRLSLKNF